MTNYDKLRLAFKLVSWEQNDLAKEIISDIPNINNYIYVILNNGHYCFELGNKYTVIDEHTADKLGLI